MCESDGRLQAQAQARPTAQSELRQTNEQAALNTRADLFGGSALGRCNSTVSEQTVVGSKRFCDACFGARCDFSALSNSPGGSTSPT